MHGVWGKIPWQGIYDIIARMLKTACGKSQQQTCKVCLRPDKFNFYVPDAIWEAVVPRKYWKLVVCLSCFDDFAVARQMDYAHCLETLLFVGDAAIFELSVDRIYGIATRKWR